MANIRNMQMWNTICHDHRIRINKSLFGLRTTAVYLPTNSELRESTIEYSPADGDRLKRILTSNADNLNAAITNFHPKPVPNGNYMVELCSTDDGTFMALQILQFQQLRYEPVTSVLMFEGEQAQIVKQIF